MHRRVIVREVVGHFFDFLLDFGRVRAFLQHDIAFARVLLPRGKRGAGTGPHGLERRLDRHGVLFGVGHALDAADGVGMPLAHAAPPEGIVRSVGQHGVCVQPVEREHARVPADRDHRGVTGLLRRRVHRREVFRDMRVRVKAVHDMEQLRHRGRLHRQIRRTPAAEDEHIHLPRVRRRVRRRIDGHAGRRDL